MSNFYPDIMDGLYYLQEGIVWIICLRLLTRMRKWGDYNRWRQSCWWRRPCWRPFWILAIPYQRGGGSGHASVVLDLYYYFIMMVIWCWSNVPHPFIGILILILHLVESSTFMIAATKLLWLRWAKQAADYDRLQARMTLTSIWSRKDNSLTNA